VLVLESGVLKMGDAMPNNRSNSVSILLCVYDFCSVSIPLKLSKGEVLIDL